MILGLLLEKFAHYAYLYSRAEPGGNAVRSPLNDL